MNLRVLPKEEIKNQLKELPDWFYEDKQLKKVLQFSNFTEATEFVAKLAPFCDAIDHHPNVSISYKTVEFLLSSHKLDAVIDADIQIAHEIERLYSATQKKSSKV